MRFESFFYRLVVSIRYAGFSVKEFFGLPHRVFMCLLRFLENK